MRVLGIDPGLTRCGYGLVEKTGRKPVALSAGVIKTSPDLEVPQRLAEMQAEIRDLLIEAQPTVVAIERVLFQVNVSTAMSVGRASGIVMAEAVNAQATVVEYSPNEVKQAVTGWGGASKEQMEQMVKAQLNIDVPLRPVDAADALGLALCHLAHAPTAAAIAKASERGKISS